MAEQPLIVSFSVLASVLPTLAYVLLIYWLDRYEKEPAGLLAVTFVWGAIPAVVLAILLEDIVGAPLARIHLISADFLATSLLAPLIEESVKAVALYALFFLFRDEFDGVLDGIVYGALIGLGFGMTENLVYFLRSFGDGGWNQWLVTVGMRSVVFGLMHAFYTGLAGAGLGYSRLAKNTQVRKWAPAVGLGAGMLAHAFHNGVLTLALGTPLGTLALAVVGDWTGILVLGGVVVFSWRRERRWIRAELEEEVRFGTLSREDYELLVSPKPRVAPFVRQWKEDGWEAARQWEQLRRNAVELAFRKHRATEEPSGRLCEAVAKLRRRVREAGLARGRDLPPGVLCPQCQHPVDTKHHYCTQCGCLMM